MSFKKVLVPVDFSKVSEDVMKVALAIANKNHMKLSLMHVDTANDSAAAYDKLKSLCEKIGCGQDPELYISEGNVLQQIVKTAAGNSIDLVVIGSHGYKGLREKIFGTDILKLLKDIEVPTLVIQKGYTIPDEGFSNILFPVGSHKYIQHQIEATAGLATLFDAMVHIYAIEKPGLEWSAELKENLKIAESEFQARGIKHEKITETATSFSVGYGKQIMDYAIRKNINLITFIANATREYYYVADSDKAIMLTNENRIPILSVSAKYDS